MPPFQKQPVYLTTEQVFAVRQFFDASSRLEYLCEAAPGTLDSEDKWRIRKFTYVGSTDDIETIKFAEGSGNFEFNVNDRATYTYI